MPNTLLSGGGSKSMDDTCAMMACAASRDSPVGLTAAHASKIKLSNRAARSGLRSVASERAKVACMSWKYFAPNALVTSRGKNSASPRASVSSLMLASAAASGERRKLDRLRARSLGASMNKERNSTSCKQPSRDTYTFSWWRSPLTPDSASTMDQPTDDRTRRSNARSVLPRLCARRNGRTPPDSGSPTLVAI
jgi:hypothetical protein